MLKILDRYLVREFIVPLFYCVVAFLLIYIIYDLSAHLDGYIENQVPFSGLLQYYLTQLPLIMVNVIPLSILLSIVYCLGALSRHNEITAMRATGISIYRIMMPFFLMGILFTLLLFYLNENFVPEAYARSEKLIEEYEQDKQKERMKPLAFFNPIAERTWDANWVPGSDTLSDVSVRLLRNKKVRQKITAEKAQFLDGEWWFFYGAIQSYSGGQLRGQDIAFSKRRFPFEEKPNDFVSSQKDSISMNFRELKSYMAFYPEDSDIYQRKLVDMYYKLALPFVGITIVLIAVPLAIKVSRGGAAGSVGVSIALCISYYFLGTVGITMGRGGVLPAWLAAWLPNIVFSAIGIVLIYRSR